MENLDSYILFQAFTEAYINHMSNVIRRVENIKKHIGIQT